MLRLQTPLDERYTGAPPDELDARIAAAKAALGDRVFILGHHYQRDEVIRWADARGDSYRLSVLAQEHARGRVHRVLRRALHGRVGRRAHRRPPDGDPPRPQRRLLDGRHGRPRRGGGGLGGAGRGHRHRAGHPDHLHELLGRAEGVRRPQRRRRVHLHQRPGRARLGARQGRRGPAGSRSAPRAAATRCCSSPTSTSAATPACRWATASTTCGCGTRATSAAASPRPTCKDATLLLWKGHCSVHQRFLPEHVEAFRAEHPDGIVVTHPECRYDTCQLADHVGSTDFIIRTVNEAPAGSVIGVGTEIHLVNRLNDETPDKTVVSLDPLVCPCSTMFRDRRRPPLLGAREPRRGQRGQPDHRRPRHDRVGQGGAAADARDRLGILGASPQWAPAGPASSAELDRV